MSYLASYGLVLIGVVMGFVTCALLTAGKVADAEIKAYEDGALNALNMVHKYQTYDREV